jgi:hypothetical protein
MNVPVRCPASPSTSDRDGRARQRPRQSVRSWAFGSVESHLKKLQGHLEHHQRHLEQLQRHLEKLQGHQEKLQGHQEKLDLVWTAVTPPIFRGLSAVRLLSRSARYGGATAYFARMKMPEVLIYSRVTHLRVAGSVQPSDKSRRLRRTVATHK